MLKLGHRGAISLKEGAPYQNSYDAFKLALKYGDGLETDACISQDGVVFLIHEAKYVQVPVEYCLEEHLDNESKARLGGRRLDQMLADEIRELRLIDGTAIPELRKLIEITSDYDDSKILNLELKGDNTGSAVLADIDWAEDQGLMKRDQFIVSSFNHPAICALSKWAENIKFGLIFALEHQERTAIFPWKGEDSKSVYEPFSLDYLAREDVQALNPAYIIIGEPVLNETVAKGIKTHLPDTKIAAWVFTELEESTDEGLKKMIADLEPQDLLHGIMIDDPRNL